MAVLVCLWYVFQAVVALATFAVGAAVVWYLWLSWREEV